MSDRHIRAIPGMTETTISAARENWHDQNPMRVILNAEADREIEKVRNTLETCGESELKNLQGKIAGIRSFLGIINNQEKKQ